ncbi:MAG TPA: hypothetical protein VFT98_20045 [Myxococcota bacterium]|nr:hypothetical protein [Myxococcota bacterium]
MQAARSEAKPSGESQRMAGAMRNLFPSGRAPAFALALALALLGAAQARADCPAGQREFRGAISAINPQKLFVDSRFDDNIGFERAPDTNVRGRAGWDALRAGDLVVICWRFQDRPRKAITITVQR